MDINSSTLKANVLVLGNSGVGKSTLINAVIGKNLAETGFGTEGVTKELKVYEDDSLNFRMIDSVGFEPSFFKRQRAISEVKKWSKKSASQGHKDNQINAIWLCVDGTSRKLFDKNLEDFSKALSFWKSVPIIVVITKSYSKPEQVENIQMIRKALVKNKILSANVRDIIPVIGQTYVVDETTFIGPEGIERLIETTNSLLPQGLQAAKNDIGSFKLNRKRFQAHSIVIAATASSVAVGAVPIAFADQFILAPIEVAMINALANIYDFKKGKEKDTFVKSIQESVAIGVAAKSAISALKAIPGINIGASIINAVVAGSLVASLGETLIYGFEQIYLGKKQEDDMIWLTKLIDAKFDKTFIKNIKDAFEKLPTNPKTNDILNVISSIFIKNK